MVIVEDAWQRNASPGSMYYRNPESTKPEDLKSLGRARLLKSCLCVSVAKDRAVTARVLVVFIGEDNPTPLSELQVQITRTRDLPLKVFVTRRSFERAEENKNEQPTYQHILADMRQEGRARAVMNILVPLLPRCRVFEFDTNTVPHGFRGHANHLSFLKLKC
ncbi:hypothetical protein BYT27DRAFT_7265442 [Phlegmacium glaucopus]|nr:hypothetical protein BYT27DRAFT_7265442 [Phlegmacium glaucopus]